MSGNLAMERFLTLVRRLEKSARLNPAGFRFRIRMLAFLGFAFILLLLLMALGLLGGIVYLIYLGVTSGIGGVKALVQSMRLFLVIGLPVLLFTVTLFAALMAAVFRLLWFRVPPPGGIRLRRGQAGRLFGLVDKLRVTLKTPPVHAILISPEFNACVQQSPRMGLLGLHVNYLVIGLPLLLALSPEQVLAVLAHEMGHVAGSHGRFALWIESVCMTWRQLAEQVEDEEDHASAIVAQFIHWYAPLFIAHVQALRRADEYAADICSKRVAGVKAAGEALVTSAVVGRFLNDQFMPRIMSHADKSDPPLFFTMLVEELGRGFTRDACAQWLNDALTQPHDPRDTHPCLTERLHAIGYPETMPGCSPRSIPLITLPSESAARHYLGKTTEDIIEFFNQAVVAIPGPQRR